ncbi:hypothetical protein ES703_97891 [subsurface metagenome]
MVKLTGPGLSIDASGSLADVLTFSNVKGHAYLKKHARPTQPRTPKQLSIRAMMSFLSAQWNLLTTPEQATWWAIVPGRAPTPYHAFISANMARWRTFRAPSKEYPATEAGGLPATFNSNVSAGVASLRIKIRTTGSPSPWSSFIFRNTSSMPAQTWDKLVGSIPWKSIAYHAYLDTPLAPGTYYYRLSTCTATGVWRHGLAQRTAIVT